MNALPLPQPGNARTYAQSWAFSVLLHGLAVGVSITLASDLKLDPQKEPFKWEVSVVETPRPKPMDTSAPSQPKPIPTQTVQTVQQVVRREMVQEISPVVQASQPTQMISRTVHAVQAPQPAVPVVTEAVMDEEARPVAKETAVVSTSQTAAPAVEEPRATATELPVQFSPATRPDYGWLAEALWNKIEQLKRYPRTARSNRWEGTVVLQAVIKADGYLQDLTVVESSGHPLLDRDAQETFRQACPLKLKHALGQPLVIVHVPISYRLD